MLNNGQHVTEGLGRTGKLRRVCLRLSEAAHGATLPLRPALEPPQAMRIGGQKRLARSPPLSCDLETVPCLSGPQREALCGPPPKRQVPTG